MILFFRPAMQTQRRNIVDGSLIEIQWCSHLLPDVEKMFSCCIFLLFVVEAEILPAICVYVYNNFLFLRTLHLLASLARRNTGCSVSWFLVLCSLYNGITLPPGRKNRAWFSLLAGSVASLNLSLGIPANSKKIGVFFLSLHKGFEELSQHITVLLALLLPAGWAEHCWQGDFMLFNWQNVRDKFCSQAA